MTVEATIAGDIAIGCLLVILAGLWVVGFINGLWILPNFYRWRRELDRRGEIPFRWVTLDYTYVWAVWRRFLQPPGGPSELEAKLKVRLLRAAKAWVAFLGIAVIATLIHYV